MSKTIKRPVNVDMCGGELQNFKLQNLTTAPSSPAAGMPYYDSTNNVPKYYNGTNFVEFGRVYSQSTGITISNDNTISVTDYAKLLKNTATGSNALTLLGTACSVPNGINIGYGSSADRECVSIGANATTNNLGVAIGYGTEASYSYSTALGTASKSTANGAIQIGYGTNATANSLNIGFYHNSATHYNYTLLDGTTGKIPDDRLSTNVLMTSLKGVANGLAELDASGKVPSSQLPAFVDDVIDLLTVASSAPATCATGDKYYNSTSSKIFTATGTNTWGTTGTTPVSDVIYVATDTNATHRWSGSTMVNISNPIGQATESTAGIAEIATNSEVTTGTDDTRIVTPLKLAEKLSEYQTSLTFSTGLTTNGSTITVTDYARLLKNTASDDNSLTLLGNATRYNDSVNIGYNSSGGQYGVALGNSAGASAYSTALGYNARTTAAKSIQIGSGTNITASTMYVGFDRTNYKLLDGTTGLIPDERISSTIKDGAAKGATAVQKFAVNNTALTASGGGVTWSITNSLSTKDVQVAVYEISSGEQIFPAVNVAQSSPYGITIELLASSNIAANTYRAVIMG